MNRVVVETCAIYLLFIIVAAEDTTTSSVWINRQSFALELLGVIQSDYQDESWGDTKVVVGQQNEANKTNRQVNVGTQTGLKNLITDIDDAFSMSRNYRRFIEWIRSFSRASRIDITNRFLVNRLASINCPALFNPDLESSLIPRFFLFNEHRPEEPVELDLQLKSSDCSMPNMFDPRRKTMLLIHGFASDMKTIGGMINIKDRLLDMNKQVLERFATNDKPKGQLYNIIFVDWYNGANPVPRFNYIKAASNSRIVGGLIARFLLRLQQECGMPINQVNMLAHSLGCHVAGFAGKALKASGHELGSITHLDPVGICFGNLFGSPQYRLNKDDALDTRAVHLAVNLFDNPMDAAKANFLVNGGRDQIGCGGQSELANSTISSASMVYDSNASFKPCSHLRAMSLYEDDLSSKPKECQIVGYECEDFQRFLAGRCGKCDRQNSQCRLMSFDPIKSPKPTSKVSSTNVTSNINSHNSHNSHNNNNNNITGLSSRYESFDDDDVDDSDEENLVGQSRDNEAKVYYVGTSSISKYCVNYYQFRMIIGEHKLRALDNENLAPNRVLQGRPPSGRNTLHFTVKLMDNRGRFFKGFALDHDVRRIKELRTTQFVEGSTTARNLEFTLLLNTTDSQPIRVAKSVISFYYHPIIVADRIEINYMSNISPG